MMSLPRRVIWSGLRRRLSSVVAGGWSCCRVAGWMLLLAGSTLAQAPADGSPSGSGDDPPLGSQQQGLADRFGQLEELFLRLSEMEADGNPARAALLQRAARLAKESSTLDRMQTAGRALETRQYALAIQEQQLVKDSLKQLLDLLQSENRADRIREERARVEQLIKEIQRLERLQRSLRGRTEGGQEADGAAGDQDDVAGQTSDLEQALRRALDVDAADLNARGADAADGAQRPIEPDSADGSESDPSQASGDSPDAGAGQPDVGERSDGESAAEQAAGEPSTKAGESQEGATPRGDTPGTESESQRSNQGTEESGGERPTESSDAKSGESGQERAEGEAAGAEQGESASDGSEGSPSGQESEPAQPGQQAKQGEQGDQGQQGQESEGGASGSAESSPPAGPEEQARQRVEQAQQRMREAAQRLREDQRPEAIKQQREAERELQEAVEQLEQILRQMREEEVERSLVQLEARLQRMLQIQLAVRGASRELAESRSAERERQIEVRSGQLAKEEQKVRVEGERALLLLEEEGSSVAFPEALEQLLVDVQQTIERLAAADLGPVTLAVQDDIVAGLEEMLEALSEVQREREEKRQQEEAGQAPQNLGEGGEEPLVGALAELRLIRTLQMRVNRRTQTLAQQLADPTDPVGQVDQPLQAEQLRELGVRQQKIQQVVRDILTMLAEER